MRLLHAPQTTATTTGKVWGILRVADSGARGVVPAAVAAAAPFRRSPGNNAACCALRLKPTPRIALSSARFASCLRTEVNRAQATPDGISPENAEAGGREQIVEKAKAEAASGIDEVQEPFRDAVESGQTIGEATTALQFGHDDGKSADEEMIHNQRKELSKQPSTTTNGQSGEAHKDPKAEVSSDVWASKDDSGSTHAFLDNEKKVDFQGQEDESVRGIGGQKAAEK